jgi:hypothetical protein
MACLFKYHAPKDLQNKSRDTYRHTEYSPNGLGCNVHRVTENPARIAHATFNQLHLVVSYADPLVAPRELGDSEDLHVCMCLV